MTSLGLATHNSQYRAYATRHYLVAHQLLRIAVTMQLSFNCYTVDIIALKAKCLFINYSSPFLFGMSLLASISANRIVSIKSAMAFISFGSDECPTGYCSTFIGDGSVLLGEGSKPRAVKKSTPAFWCSMSTISS
jgi:hypothetical protein